MLLTACALRSLFGNVIIVNDIGEEVNEIITTVFSDSTAAVCIEADYGFYECTYIIDGDIITSTLYLLSEYGLAGVLIDPVILQVPADTSAVHATYDEGGGPKPLIAQLTPDFLVAPGITVTAEANEKFLILELPSSVTRNLPAVDPSLAPELTYSLTFTRTQPIGIPIPPMHIKAMLAGKVIINSHAYYVPTLPCRTDFAGIPPIEIPQSATSVDLQPAIGNLIRQAASSPACDHQAYFFNNIPPPAESLFLPIIQH